MFKRKAKRELIKEGNQENDFFFQLATTKQRNLKKRKEE